jgi:peptide/nickel transport system substrate-binding protein
MVKLIERGSYDGDMLLPSHVDELRARYASRVHRIRVGGTNFLYLNPALPPFDRLAVRQALNLAIDRRAALKWPGATPTCQVLPPGFPAYRPYCPYTLHPGARWTAPDVARARRLVTATGTSGMRVTIWTTQGFEPEVAAAERALRHLGYRPTHRIVSFEKLLAGASREQITVMGWLADYPAASNFFASFACRKTILGSCDPSVARRIAQALAAQASNPEATDPQWTALDRRIVDLALSVPLFNPGGYTLTSERVGNYQSHFVYATLLDQLWVR